MNPLLTFSGGLESASFSTIGIVRTFLSHRTIKTAASRMGMLSRRDQTRCVALEEIWQISQPEQPSSVPRL
jgi:hypothetical protein